MGSDPELVCVGGGWGGASPHYPFRVFYGVYIYIYIYIYQSEGEGPRTDYLSSWVRGGVDLGGLCPPRPDPLLNGSATTTPPHLPPHPPPPNPHPTPHPTPPPRKPVLRNRPMGAIPGSPFPRNPTHQQDSRTAAQQHSSTAAQQHSSTAAQQGSRIAGRTAGQQDSRTAGQQDQSC